jgi:hypothetical protein
MFSLLLLAKLAAFGTDDSVDENTERCRTQITSRLGELGTFAPASTIRRGRTTIIRGTTDSLEKAPPAAPGMAAPTHVLVTRYSFRCEFRLDVVRRVTLHRQAS